MRRFSNGLRSDTGDVIRSTASLGRSSLHRLGSVERPIEEVKEAGAALDSAERRKAALTVERDWGEPRPDPVGIFIRRDQQRRGCGTDLQEKSRQG